ncbi:MAG: NADH-quinone oxidoreductase subunit J [Acidobacteria bacterium]|nr:NADH-quinone oxidoreductase subunit J [Acidobacteriota bacterium]
MIDQIIFYTLAFIIVAMSLMVILARNAVRSALYLISALLGFAALYIRLQAELLAGVQILVYVGGIMVLFLFVIMLVSVRTMEHQARQTRQWKAAVVIALGVAAELIYLIVRGGSIFVTKQPPDALLTKSQNTQVVGEALYSTYLLPFEIASVLLLVAMIGAVVLAKKKI